MPARDSCSLEQPCVSGSAHGTVRDIPPGLCKPFQVLYPSRRCYLNWSISWKTHVAAERVPASSTRTASAGAASAGTARRCVFPRGPSPVWRSPKRPTRQSQLQILCPSADRCPVDMAVGRAKSSKTQSLDAALGEVIQMALSDHVSFEQIQLQTGLSADQVKALMRRELKRGSYVAWRKRVREFSERRGAYKRGVAQVSPYDRPSCR